MSWCYVMMSGRAQHRGPRESNLRHVGVGAIDVGCQLERHQVGKPHFHGDVRGQRNARMLGREVHVRHMRWGRQSGCESGVAFMHACGCDVRECYASSIVQICLGAIGTSRAARQPFVFV